MKNREKHNGIIAIIYILAIFLFMLIGNQTVTAAPSAKDYLKEGDNFFEQWKRINNKETVQAEGIFDRAIRYYELILKEYPRAREANEAKKRLEDPLVLAEQKRRLDKEALGPIREGDRYFAEGKKDWEAEKRFTGNWNNWSRDSVDYLRRAKVAYNKALAIDPTNAQAQQGLANVRQLEAEIETVDNQGFVNLWSGIAGVVLLNGEQTDFNMTADSTVRIVIDNANGVYELAVKDGTGKVFPASSKITINGTGLRKTYSSSVFNPNPAPNSGDDFGIRQNSQGGITITGYTGTRLQVVIPETISGIKVTEIGAGALSWRRQWNVYEERYVIIGKEIRTVVIPNSVTQIGEGAFAFNSITSVVLPNAITAIPKRAFYDCVLETVTIPNSVTTIGEEAFARNVLTSVTFGNRIAEIGPGAFMYNGLTELKNLPASLKIIYSGAFAENDITTLTIPNGVTLLWPYSFSNNPINTLVIPSSLAELRGHPSGTMYRVDRYYTAGFGTAFRRVGEWSSRNNWDCDGGDSYPMNIIIGTTITLPANVVDDNLNRNFNSTIIDFYKSQNKKAGIYSFDGRLWTVK